jgi:hypothetical protein
VKRALSLAPLNDSYLRWDAPGVEPPKLDKDETTKKAGETMNRMQQHNFDQHQHKGIAKGKLIVLSNLPTHSQQGLFKTPGEIYNMNLSFFKLVRNVDPQGLGMRIFGVQGERLKTSDPKANTQDSTNKISHSLYTQSAFRFGNWYGHMALFLVLDNTKNRADEVKSSELGSASRSTVGILRSKRRQV